MQLKIFPYMLVAVILAPFLPTEAQPEKVRTVGRMGAGSASDPMSAASFEAFRQSLRELGWIDGKNLTIEARWAGATLGRFAPLAAELVRLRPDVIVAAGSAPTRALKEATATIPTVMAASGDPLSQGLVSSLAKPGGNITGLSLLTPELAGKRLELLTEVVPEAMRIAVLENTGSPTRASQWNEVETTGNQSAYNFAPRRCEDRRILTTHFPRSVRLGLAPSSCLRTP
jgi:putative ABC transport system substrate-binding protein